MAHSRFLAFYAFSLALGLVSAGAQAGGLQVYPGCATPPATITGHVHYIDAVNGSPEGDGSQAKPWNSLQAVFATTTSYANNKAWLTPSCQALAPTAANYSRCLTGPLLSTVSYYHDDPAKGWTTSVNPNAPIQPGDAIVLMNGNYGDVVITDVVNPQFLTIMAGPGQTPVLTSATVSGSTKFLFEGLKFQDNVNPANIYAALFTAREDGATKLSSDIILDNAVLNSQDDISSWSMAEWIAKGRSRGIDLDQIDGPACFSVTNTKVSNLRSGVSLGANYTLYANNSIDNFGDDGLDYEANNLIISHNSVTNSNTIGDGNHNDCMQGQSGRAKSYSNITIDSNVCLAQTSAALKFPGGEQGIDAFDNDWYNVTVTNNVIVVTDYQGLSYASLHGGLIANNTVLSQSPTITSWISVNDKTHEGSTSNNVVVRNNLTSSLSMGATSPSITIDHNMSSGNIAMFDQATQKEAWYNSTHSTVVGDGNTFDKNNFADVFTQFDPVHFVYNLTLLPNSAARGSGSTDPAVGVANPISAPPLDITGATRTTPIDLGAYKLVTAPAAGSGGVPIPTNPYTASLTVEATARQTGTPPQLVALVDGQVVGTANVTADIHVGQILNYVFNITTPAHPKNLVLELKGYGQEVEKYVSLDIFHARLEDAGSKTAKELVGTGSVAAGNIIVAPGLEAFETNGSMMQYNITQD